MPGSCSIPWIRLSQCACTRAHGSVVGQPGAPHRFALYFHVGATGVGNQVRDAFRGGEVRQVRTPPSCASWRAVVPPQYFPASAACALTADGQAGWRMVGQSMGLASRPPPKQPCFADGHRGKGTGKPGLRSGAAHVSATRGAGQTTPRRRTSKGRRCEG